MFLRVSELELGKVRFHETLAPGAVDFFDAQLRQSGPMTADGAAELSQATREILIGGHITAKMEIACDRCLESTVTNVDSGFNLLYRPAEYSPESGEVLLKESEADVGFYEGDGIELNDVLREQILLLLPMQRICSEDCKGICPVCGQNRNQVECHCHPQAPDDRWAGLRNLRTNQ